jgi:hypothetical protein
MRKLLPALVLVLAGVVAGQTASVTYINQKAPGWSYNPPLLTALNLPRIGTTFQIKLAPSWGTVGACGAWDSA